MKNIIKKLRMESNYFTFQLWMYSNSMYKYAQNLKAMSGPQKRKLSEHFWESLKHIKIDGGYQLNGDGELVSAIPDFNQLLPALMSIRSGQKMQTNDPFMWLPKPNSKKNSRNIPKQEALLEICKEPLMYLPYFLVKLADSRAYFEIGSGLELDQEFDVITLKSETDKRILDFLPHTFLLKFESPIGIQKTERIFHYNEIVFSKGNDGIWRVLTGEKKEDSDAYIAQLNSFYLELESARKNDVSSIESISKKIYEFQMSSNSPLSYFQLNLDNGHGQASGPFIQKIESIFMGFAYLWHQYQKIVSDTLDTRDKGGIHFNREVRVGSPSDDRGFAEEDNFFSVDYSNEVVSIRRQTIKKEGVVTTKGLIIRNRASPTLHIRKPHNGYMRRPRGLGNVDGIEKTVVVKAADPTKLILVVGKGMRLAKKVKK